jgi:hypothetical protein
MPGGIQACVSIQLDGTCGSWDWSFEHQHVGLGQKVLLRDWPRYSRSTTSISFSPAGTPLLVRSARSTVNVLDLAALLARQTIDCAKLGDNLYLSPDIGQTVKTRVTTRSTAAQSKKNILILTMSARELSILPTWRAFNLPLNCWPDHLSSIVVESRISKRLRPR